MSANMIKKIAPPPFCEKEALRYAGCKVKDNETEVLLNTCFKEVENKLKYSVCYCELEVQTVGEICDFGAFSVKSKALAKNLEGVQKVLLFGATIGVEIDRLIAKYGKLSPSCALMLQAIGAERIEALCDTFCEEYEKENGVFLKPRFSPGYADLSLEVQRDIFSVLDLPRKIGLSLTDSLLMSPVKSVTAFAGITKQEVLKSNKCELCENTNCEFGSRR